MSSACVVCECVCVEYVNRFLHLKCFFTRLVSNLDNCMVYLGARRFHIRYLCLVIRIVFKTLSELNIHICINTILKGKVKIKFLLLLLLLLLLRRNGPSF